MTLTTPVGGSTAISASATGNDVIYSQGYDTVTAGGGNDTIYASGASATVTGGTGPFTFVAGNGFYQVQGGSGVDIIYGGTHSNTPGTGFTDNLTSGSALNNIIVAGSANAQLSAGTGGQTVMFGGSGTNSFQGGSQGHDTMVGGSGTSNAYIMTNGDIAFGGSNSHGTDQVTGLISGNGLVVEGPGTTLVEFAFGSITAFDGTGQDTYEVSKGAMSPVNSIIGFKAADNIKMDGFTPQDVASAIKNETTGSFGTTLNFSDGAKLVLFGATVTQSQLISNF